MRAPQALERKDGGGRGGPFPPLCDLEESACSLCALLIISPFCRHPGEM